jgi:hypothetical protein
MQHPVTKPLNALEALERAQWIAFAPFVFQATRVLRDRGVLKAIEASPGGLTLDATAAAAGLPVYGTRVLLEAGLGIGLVVEVDGRYRLTKTATYILHDPMTRANMDFTRDVNYLGLAHLDEAIATGKPAGLKVFGEWSTVYAALAQLPEFVRDSWFQFDHHYSDGAFGAALPLVFRARPRRLLDIGGNTGKWALACLRHDPAVEITILDLPGQLRNAQDGLRAAGLQSRVALPRGRPARRRLRGPARPRRHLDEPVPRLLLRARDRVDPPPLRRRPRAPTPASTSSRPSGTASASRPRASACR